MALKQVGKKIGRVIEANRSRVAADGSDLGGLAAFVPTIGVSGSIVVYTYRAEQRAKKEHEAHEKRMREDREVLEELCRNRSPSK